MSLNTARKVTSSYRSNLTGCVILLIPQAHGRMSVGLRLGCQDGFET